MTTIIPSKSPNPLRPLSLVISDGDDNPVHFSIDLGPDSAQINVDRTALLDAVRSELGVLIIDASQEPLAQWEKELLVTTDDENLTAENADALAVYYAGLATEKRKSPPVDEQQVEALEALLNETSDGHAQSAPNIARRLIATGKVTVQS